MIARLGRQEQVHHARLGAGHERGQIQRLVELRDAAARRWNGNGRARAMQRPVATERDDYAIVRVHPVTREQEQPHQRCAARELGGRRAASHCVTVLTQFHSEQHL